MTATRFEMKVRPRNWDEGEHPRDRKGRFIETGAFVRIWGGGSGKVVGNVGNGRIEVERDSDGKRIVVHRNYLTVTARPNGEAPTDEESADVEAAPVTTATPDAEVVPDLAEADDAEVALPDRGEAPDHLVDAVTVGESQNGRTVGEWVDGPGGVDGHVVGFTEQGGPIVRTEDGKDWPLLPDAEVVANPDGPEMPEEWATGAGESDIAQRLNDPEAQRARLGTAPEAPLDDDEISAQRQREAQERVDARATETAPAPAEATPGAGDQPEPLNSVNPSDSGVFEDYESGREYRATAPLADNMTTLAETEGVDPDETVTLYRGVPDDAPEGIQPGDFVTTNEQLARDYMGGTGRIEQVEARYGDVLDDRDEPGGEEYIYRPQAADDATPAAPAVGEAPAANYADMSDRDLLAAFDGLDASTPDGDAEALAAEYDRREREAMTWGPADDITPEERQRRTERLDAFLAFDGLNADSRGYMENTRRGYAEPDSAPEAAPAAPAADPNADARAAVTAAERSLIDFIEGQPAPDTMTDRERSNQSRMLSSLIDNEMTSETVRGVAQTRLDALNGAAVDNESDEPRWVVDVSGRPAPADMSDADLRSEYDALDLPLSGSDEANAEGAEADMAATPRDTPGVAAMRERRNALGIEIDDRAAAARQQRAGTGSRFAQPEPVPEPEAPSDLSTALAEIERRRGVAADRLRADGVDQHGVEIGAPVLGGAEGDQTISRYIDGETLTGDEYRDLAHEFEAAADLLGDDSDPDHETYLGLAESMYSRAADMDDAARRAPEATPEVPDTPDAPQAPQMLGRRERPTTEGTRIPVTEVKPGDTLNTLDFGDFHIAEVNARQRTAGRAAGDNGSGGGRELVGVDADGNLRRLVVLHDRSSFRRISEGEAPTLPDRAPIRTPIAEIKPGDRIDLPGQGDAIVVDVRTGVGNTGQSTDMFLDMLDGDGPRSHRVRNNQYIQRTGENEPVNPDHRRVMAEADRRFADPAVARDEYFERVVDDVNSDLRKGVLTVDDLPEAPQDDSGETLFPDETPEVSDRPLVAERVGDRWNVRTAEGIDLGPAASLPGDVPEEQVNAYIDDLLGLDVDSWTREGIAERAADLRRQIMGIRDQRRSAWEQERDAALPDGRRDPRSFTTPNGDVRLGRRTDDLRVGDRVHVASNGSTYQVSLTGAGPVASGAPGGGTMFPIGNDVMTIESIDGDRINFADGRWASIEEFQRPDPITRTSGRDREVWVEPSEGSAPDTDTPDETPVAPDMVERVQTRIEELLQRGEAETYDEAAIEAERQIAEEDARVDAVDLPDEPVDQQPAVRGPSASQGRRTTFTTPDGVTHTRNSKNNTYTHVVVVGPATPEDRRAAFNREADALDAQADRLDAAADAGRVKKRSRDSGDDPANFNAYDFGLVDPEAPASTGRRAPEIEWLIRTRGNSENRASLTYSTDLDLDQSLVEARTEHWFGEDREIQTAPVRAVLVAQARRDAATKREQAIALRAEGEKPDTDGYAVMRWSSNPALARRAAENEFAYQRERYGKQVYVAEVDSAEEPTGTPRGGTGGQPGPTPTPDPDGDRTEVPKVGSQAAAAKYIVTTAGVTDPEMRRAVQDALSVQITAKQGEGRRKVWESGNADLIALTQAAIGGIQTKPEGPRRKAWDADAARTSLQRLADGDPTLPTSRLVGQRVGLDVIDMDAPIVLGRPAASKRVEGVVRSVESEYTWQMRVVIDGDDGEAHTAVFAAGGFVPRAADPDSPIDHPARAIADADPDPIEFRYVRNPQSSTANVTGSDFGQDIEPAGRYLNSTTDDAPTPDGWETGRVSFQKPLVMDFGGGYSEPDNWKRRLSAHYGGLTGEALSDAVRGDGYDAIITRDKYGDSEIVDLSQGAAEVTPEPAPTPDLTPDPDPVPDGSVPLDSLRDATNSGRDKDQWYTLAWGDDVDPEGYYASNPANNRPFKARAVHKPINGTTTPGEDDLRVVFENDEGMEGEMELPPDARLTPIDPPQHTTITGRIEHASGDYEGPLYRIGGGANQFPEGTYRAAGDDGRAYDVTVDQRGRATVTPAVDEGDNEAFLRSLITPLPDFDRDPADLTDAEIATAIKGIDDNIVTTAPGSDERTRLLGYRARLVGEQQRRNAVVPPPSPEPDPTDQTEVAVDPTRAGDLAVGDKVVFDDGTLVEITSIDAEGGEFGYRDADGNEGVYYADADTMMQRVAADGPTPPVSPAPPENPDPEVGREAQVTVQNLVPGDTVWLGGNKVTIDAIEPRDADSMDVTIRYADRRTETHPFGREVVLDRGDDAFLPDPSPLDADTPTARPVLYTYQRRNIVALGLDNDSDPMVAEAARRIRKRQPLAAAHANALALRLSEMSAADGVKPQRARMLARLAHANNAAAIEAGGRGVDLPPLPNADRVTKGRPGDMGVGDQIAFMNGRRLAQGKVTDIRRMMGGRLTEVTYTEPDGTTWTTMLSKNTDVYVLPDLPEPIPAPSSSDLPELVGVADLRPGDRIRIPSRTTLFDAEMTLTEATVLARTEGNDGFARVTLDVHSVDSMADDQAFELTSNPEFNEAIVRVSRGTESADQPRERDLPAFAPEEINASEVGVGDWLQVVVGGRGASYDGIVTEIEVINDEDGNRIGQRFNLHAVGGRGNWFTVTDREDYTMTRLVAGDRNTVLRMEEERRERARRTTTLRTAAVIDEAVADYNEMLHFRLAQNALMGGSVPDEHYEQAIATAFDGGDATTDIGQDRDLYVRKLARNLQPVLSGHTAGPEYDGVRDAAWRLAEQILNDHHARMRQGFLDVRATEPGGSRAQAGVAMAKSVFRPEAFGPSSIESRDTMAIARSIALAREAREAANAPEAQDRDFTVPDLPEGTSLADRMAAYRSRLSSRFGFTDSQVTTYGEFDLDSLERGEVPPLATATSRVADRAADNGPGADTMAQLEVLRAAGADLDAEVQKRIDPSLPGQIEQAEVEKDAAYARYEALRKQENAIYADTQNRLAREHGFADWNAMSFARLGNARHEYEARAGEPLNAAVNRVREQVDAAIADIRALGDEAHSNWKTIDQRWKDIRARLAETRAKAARDVLAEVRDMGGVELSYRTAGRRKMETTQTPLRNGETMKAMRFAEQHYPKEWLDLLNGSPKGAIAVGTTKRGFFQETAWIIRLSVDDQRNGATPWVPPRGRVATHELGHAMETVVPGLAKAEEAFLWSRTASGEIGERRRKRTKTTDGSPVYGDEFKGDYSGKDYGDGKFYELFTTGAESLFAGSDYMDDDYRRWMMGVLALL